MSLTMHCIGPSILSPARIRFGYTLRGSPGFYTCNALIHFLCRQFCSIYAHTYQTPSVLYQVLFLRSATGIRVTDISNDIPEQNDIVCKCFYFRSRITKAFFPIIEAASVDTHRFHSTLTGNSPDNSSIISYSSCRRL